ncbi:MAG: class I SAM-dependent methyltransferase [Clostridia bacterium]|nr:class I SAM-dependent methyltransferase [Clostridia bacterium]
MQDNRQINDNRFTGLAQIYDKSRPSMPSYPAEIIAKYLGRTPGLVVDLGCGSGLSTTIWQGRAGKAVGIEPNDDMLAAALQKTSESVSFRKGWGHDTGLPDGCADAVVCSQSFHWMEPVSTLAEVSRILVPGGVFATVDCDWPPVTLWEAEKAYMDLYEKGRALEKTLPQLKGTYIRYPKDRHLANIRESGHFRYCRELLFTNTESCTADRLCDLLLSQGSFRSVLKLVPALQEDVDAFRETLSQIYGGETFEIGFCYRMRIGVK